MRRHQRPTAISGLPRRPRDEDGQCEQVLRSDPSTWGVIFATPHGIITGWLMVGGQCEQDPRPRSIAQDPLPKIHCPRSIAQDPLPTSLAFAGTCLPATVSLLWNLQTLPAVRAAFEQIWDTPTWSLHDGGNAFCRGRRAAQQGGWWHCDQNGLRPGRRGRVQGSSL